MKEREVSEFAKLYYNRFSPDQICRVLKISRATYYRYLGALANREKEHLDEHGRDVLWATIGKVRNSFSFVGSRAAEMVGNKDGKYTPDQMLAAGNLLCEIEAADLRLLTEGPITTMKEMPVRLRRKLVTQEEEEYESVPVNVEIEGEEEEEGEEGEEKEKGDADKKSQGHKP